MTRAEDVKKLIQSWEEESGIELLPGQREKLHERIERFAQEEFKQAWSTRSYV